ncbi:MAG: helix-turn-helix domain-containing protein [Janthinobacterium lividum]
MVDDAETQGLYRQLGASIARERRKKGLSQEVLAAKLQLTRTSVTNIENGRQHVQIHTLYAVANVFGISLADLLPTAAVLQEMKASRRMSITNEQWLEQLNVPVRKSGGSNE